MRPTRDTHDHIIVKGCRVHNLKSIDVSIPRNKLTVITGVSGSGKSSLAFDTLYAEGQRRYVESLSAYARQFLSRMKKPECDLLLNIPPAVAIEQRVVSRNPRSTVGTSSEIYDYLRILMARAGRMISPISGREVKKHTINDVILFVQSLPQGSQIMILVPVHFDVNERSLQQQLNMLLQQGYTRIFHDQKTTRIEDLLTQTEEGQPSPLDTTDSQTILPIIDRLTIDDPQGDVFLSRLADSVENAFYEGKGSCIIYSKTPDGGEQQTEFNNRFEADGRTFSELTPDLFNFNAGSGACPECEGFGSIVGIDPKLVIPDEDLSVYEGAVACWVGAKSKTVLDLFTQRIQTKGLDFNLHKPYRELNEEEKHLLWHGYPGDKIGASEKDVFGIYDYFSWLKAEIYKVQNRVRIAHFSGKTLCPSCKGGRLQEDALLVRYQGKNIAEITQMSIDKAIEFFAQEPDSETDKKITKRLLKEINSRLQVLSDVGLGYLTLDRRSNTLSGGESQRINLSTRLGNSLVGSLYVLDEPSIGLHERDTDRLISVMESLRDQGNTVVVVEHDEHTMRAADYIIDIGPDAGRLGGEVVFAGNYSDINKQTPGHTAAYLTHKEAIPLPLSRRPVHRAIQVRKAYGNNLKGIDVTFPLNVFTVVTGVSGSGKSTLVHDVLFSKLTDLQNGMRQESQRSRIEGDWQLIDGICYVDQSNVGRSTRSNPATYIGAYSYIREFYSELPLSRQMGYKPYMFSFNKEGGRCETCKGEGTVTIEMQFMTDITVECEDCKGHRFTREVLEVECDGVNIDQLLNMTVNNAVEFFSRQPGDLPLTIISLLEALQRVGLGYIQLGQSSSTLSGGENQRLKLARYLAAEKSKPTLFVFDEPTTGLHFHDIATLLMAFNSLVDQGHTVVVIEHNLEVIKCADYVIDMGPEGGDKGGYLVAQGTPEEIVATPESITGQYLREKLEVAKSSENTNRSSKRKCSR